MFFGEIKYRVVRINSNLGDHQFQIRYTHTHMYTHIYHDDQNSIIGTYTEKRKKPKQC